MPISFLTKACFLVSQFIPWFKWNRLNYFCLMVELSSVPSLQSYVQCARLLNPPTQILLERKGRTDWWAVKVMPSSRWVASTRLQFWLNVSQWTLWALHNNGFPFHCLPLLSYAQFMYTSIRHVYHLYLFIPDTWTVIWQIEVVVNVHPKGEGPTIGRQCQSKDGREDQRSYSLGVCFVRCHAQQRWAMKLSHTWVGGERWRLWRELNPPFL